MATGRSSTASSTTTQSEAPEGKDLWTLGEYGDFVLRFEWRIKETPYTNPNVPIIRHDGTRKK